MLRRKKRTIESRKEAGDIKKTRKKRRKEKVENCCREGERVENAERGNNKRRRSFRKEERTNS